MIIRSPPHEVPILLRRPPPHPEADRLDREATQPTEWHDCNRARTLLPQLAAACRELQQKSEGEAVAELKHNG